jgi:hypothetical protein
MIGILCRVSPTRMRALVRPPTFHSGIIFPLQSPHGSRGKYRFVCQCCAYHDGQYQHGYVARSKQFDSSLSRYGESLMQFDAPALIPSAGTLLVTQERVARFQFCLYVPFINVLWALTNPSSPRTSKCGNFRFETA